MKATLKSAFPYQNDKMHLPLRDLEAALPYYQQVLGFTLVSRVTEPFVSAVLERDGIEIGLAENGGDPEQEGCFFEVDDVEAAFAEFKSNGLNQDAPNYRIDQYGPNTFKVFFIVAPDGLCYCLGQRQ